MPLTVPDLALYLREPIPDDQLTAAEQLVGLVNGLVEDVTGVLVDEPPRVQAVRLEVAARAWRNPAGNTSETTGPFTWRNDRIARAGVYLTDEERADLLALTGGLDTGPWAGSLPYRRS